MEEATEPATPEVDGYYTDWLAALPGEAYYKYMWYGLARQDGGYDFAAEGDKDSSSTSRRTRPGHRAQWDGVRHGVGGVDQSLR